MGNRSFTLTNDQAPVRAAPRAFAGPRGRNAAAVEANDTNAPGLVAVIILVVLAALAIRERNEVQ